MTHTKLFVALALALIGCSTEPGKKPDASTEAATVAPPAPSLFASQNYANPIGPAGGNLSGTYPNPVVSEINGIKITGTPSAGYVITAVGPDSGIWEAPTLASQPTGTGVWHEVDGGLQAAALKGTAGQFLTENGTATDVSFASCSGDVSCATGTPGQYTVLDVHGASVPAAGSLTTGNTLGVTGSSALGYSALNLGGGAGYVSGALPVGNFAPGTAAQVLVTNSGATAPAWVSLSQDVTTTAAGVTTVNSINGATPIAIAPNVLQWAKTTTTPTLTQLAPTSDLATFNMELEAQSALSSSSTHPNGADLVLQGSACSVTGTSGAGTVAVNNGSPTVTGTSTAFAGTMSGSQITISGVTYTILSVASTTSMTLTANYAGTNASGLSYTLTDGVAGSVDVLLGNSGTGAALSMLKVQNVGTAGTPVNLWQIGPCFGAGNSYASESCLYPATVTPSSTNYAVETTPTQVNVNAVTAVELLIGGTAQQETLSNITAFFSPSVEFASTVTAGTFLEAKPTSDLATHTVVYSGQSAFQSAATNVNGSPMLAYGGAATTNGTTGLRGPFRASIGADSAEVCIEAAETAVGKRVWALGQFGSGITSTQMPSACGDEDGWIGNSNTAPTIDSCLPVGGAAIGMTAGSMTMIATSGWATQMNQAGAGVVNSQVQEYLAPSGTVRISSSSAATVATAAIATSATSAEVEAKVVCRMTTLETGGAVGDTYTSKIEGAFKNISGTVTQVGSTTTLAQHNDTFLSTVTVIFTISGTNVLVQATGPTTLSAGVMDCEGIAWSLID